ncbi:hypothetical protein HETIRDRAFT_447253 [Heterobasidion irregulare TC 32-1]|uniref:Uncharacterized protein n=1 Tax=Heterobasidion irregulare (strain TC 32-1) TaxID=747525 RepID=W4KMD0_HETIT|nr:uncharacterized protein HETIRDRAFT_447253 [Heterobasidion irregulare TC 32-1]ETW86535.1 hypothetical protein HETIRDRAFT_447253 [Heterobasidion irregulare TC 32-1]
MNDRIITPICLNVKVSNRSQYTGAKATIDSACKGVIVNETWVKRHRFPTYTLNNPIRVRNVDDTINKAGKDDLILGTDWLKYHDPSIKWRRREVHFDRCPQKCQQLHGFTRAREEPQNNRRLSDVEPRHKPRINEREKQRLEHLQRLSEDVGLRDHSGTFGKQAIEEPVIRKLAPEPSGFASFDQDLEDEIVVTNLKERVPKAHHEFLDIFSERKSQRLPEHTY